MDGGASGGGGATVGLANGRSGLKGVAGIGVATASALMFSGGGGGVSASAARGLTDQ